MSYEIKDMTGSLFVNDNKVEGTRQPDFTGNIKIGGKTYRLAGWNTESRGGIEYVSLAVTDPDEYKRQQERQQERQSSGGSRFPGRSSSLQAPSRRLSDEEFEKRRQEMQQNIKPRSSLPDDLDDDDIPF